MEGAIYIESKQDASLASLVLPTEYDFTDGKYECALIEVFIPNTQKISLPSSKVWMLWYLPMDFEDDNWQILKTGRKEMIDGSTMMFMEEGIEPIPSLPPRDGVDLYTCLSRHFDREQKFEGKKTHVSYFRGFCNIHVSERKDINGKVAIGFPIFRKEVKDILGMEEDENDEIVKEFLKTANELSYYPSPKVANIHMMVFFNEIYFNAVGCIIPRMEHKIIRYLSNIPTSPRSVHYHFDPPIWCPVQAKKFKDFTVEIKDNADRKAVFEGGNSLFKICFRRKHG